MAYYNKRPSIVIIPYGKLYAQMELRIVGIFTYANSKTQEGCYPEKSHMKYYP